MDLPFKEFGRLSEDQWRSFNPIIDVGRKILACATVTVVLIFVLWAIWR